MAQRSLATSRASTPRPSHRPDWRSPNATSIAVTRAPARAAKKDNVPGPAATSSTRAPGARAARSIAFPANQANRGATSAAYADATRVQGAGPERGLDEVMVHELRTNCQALFSRGEHSCSQKPRFTCSTEESIALASRRVLDAMTYSLGSFPLKLCALRRHYPDGCLVARRQSTKKEVS